MKAPDARRAVAAAVAIASAQGLDVAVARVLHDSNKLAVRLLPCETVARVAFAGDETFETELEIGRRLADTGSPVARLDPRVEPRVQPWDGFVVTLWTHYEQLRRDIPPEDYAAGLERLHAGMARVEVAVPRFDDRVEEARQLVASTNRTPALPDSDRELLSAVLRDGSRRIREHSSREQLLHGEPHPGNVLDTETGPLFVDLETCCRRPVEFDLAHVPEAVSDCYPRVDDVLLGECRLLVLAMVAAWRWDLADEFPNGEQAGQMLLEALRAGPPWPNLDVVMRRAGVPGRDQSA